MFATLNVTRREYLDGLRGWGALFVLFYHATQMWGENAPVRSFSLWGSQHSLLWFFADGRFAVYVFFAISGFVLSIGFFERGKATDVASLAIRRYPRLALPVLFYCILVFLVGNSFSQFISERANAYGVHLTYYLQANPSLRETINFALVGAFWGTDRPLTLTPQLWTMPIEMIGSFVIFATLLFCGKNDYRRVVGYLAVIGTCFFGNLAIGSGLAAMAIGMALAHITSRPWHIAFEKTLTSQIIGGLALAIAVAMAALRNPARDNILPLCGVLVLYAALTLRPFQYALDRPASQWLGRVSFPLYLTHLLGLYSIIGILAPWQASHASVVWLIAVVVALLFARICLPVETFSTAFSRKFYKVIRGTGRMLVSSVRT